MNAASDVSSSFSFSRSRAWLALLALCLLFLFVDTRVRLSSIQTVTSSTLSAVTPPARDSLSPSGYHSHQHNLVLPYVSTDGYHWIMQTERMIADGSWRIRHWERDNAPLGRAVHWSSAVRWWLASVAAAVQLLDPDATSARALEFVAPLASPLLLGLMLLALVPFVARRFGRDAAMLTAAGPVALYPLYQYFAAGVVDHHGMAALCALLALLLPLGGGAGWIVDDNTAPLHSPDGRLAQWLLQESAARKWFVAAGIAGGTGIWISATTVVPVLVAIGAGALAITRYASTEYANYRYAPRLWRAWAIAGGSTSLLFYLLEYAPGAFSLRLEVNHPLYALAWIAGGELICAAAAARMRGVTALRALRSPRALIALAVLAALPVTLVVRSDAFRLIDPFLATLHRDYILEFRSMLRQPSWWDGWQLVQGSALPLLVTPIVLVVLWLVRGVAAPARSMIVLGAVPVLLVGCLAFLQVRWIGLACALLLAFICAAAFLTRTGITGFAWSRALRRSTLVVLVLLLLPYPVFTAAFPWRFGQPAPLDLYQLVARDVARTLRQRAGNAPVTVLSGPTSTTWLMYFGGFHGLGTLYWENTEGLKAAAAIYAAPGDAAARTLIAARGVTHVVFFSWDAFTTEYTRLARLADPAIGADSAFGARLLRGDVPGWLYPVPYEVPPLGVLRGARVHIFEVGREPPQ